jgi:hypothetical protein
MKKVFNTILSVIVVFVINLLLTTTVNYFFQSDGSISTDTYFSIQNKLFAEISIQNYSSKTKDGLILSIPNKVNLKEIICSNPVDIVNKQDSIVNSIIKNIDVSSIAPNKTTKILIPVNNISELNFIDVQNYSALSLTKYKSNEILNPLTDTINKAIISSIIFAIFGGLIMFYQIVKFDDLNKKMDKINKYSETIQKASDDLKITLNKEFIDIKKIYHKQRIFLFHRISDLTKELDFWRDTIRKILYNRSKGKDMGEEIIKEVVNNLKTYSTLGKSNENFENIQLLSSMLANRKDE